MKTKKIILMLVMIMTAMSVSAQYDPGKWAIQIKFGFGAAQLTNVDKLPMTANSSDSQFTGASLVGMDVEYQVSKMLGISLGLNRSHQGCAWKDYTDNSVKYKEPTVELEYLTFPLVANLYVYKGLALKTGVQLGYLIDADFTQHFDENYQNRELTTRQTLDIEDDCKKMDISIPVGISYESKGHFVFDARYNIGLTKVNDKDFFGAKDIKNGVFMITIGYKFDI